jgi:MATE family multidrug resistance protein
MLWLIFIPVGIMWTNVAPILMALGQDEELSRGTQQYLRVLLLAAPGYIGFETLKKYLQCQGIFSLFLCLEPRCERLTARYQI